MSVPPPSCTGAPTEPGAASYPQSQSLSSAVVQVRHSASMGEQELMMGVAADFWINILLCEFFGLAGGWERLMIVVWDFSHPWMDPRR